MTIDEALAYIHGTNRAFCKPGLERVSTLLSSLDNPEKHLRYVHVAGTNGKGSTSSMLARVLEESGYRVGLYTSPYILRFNERIRVAGECISDEALVKLTERIRSVADAMADRPTEFEIITAIAFSYFLEEKCDIVVLEVGLGGRFDATNVIENPEVSVITGIALDHVAILGDTIEKIAYEKAGIIKAGAPVVWGGKDAAARKVIKDIAKERGSAFYESDLSKAVCHESGILGSIFDYRSLQNIKISLSGTYQIQNAATVIEAVEVLKNRGYKISEDAMRRGLSTTVWQARFEVLSKDPLVIFDGAHNPEGIGVAVESVKQYFKDERVLILSGVLADKDYVSVATSLASIGRRAYTITPDNPRALDGKDYAALLSSLGCEATACASIEEGVTRAMEDAEGSGLPLLCLGSLYTYREVREAVEHYRTK